MNPNPITIEKQDLLHLLETDGAVGRPSKALLIMDSAIVHHHVILSTEHSMAAHIAAWNRVWGDVLRPDMAHQGCFASEWALFVEFGPLADQGSLWHSSIIERTVSHGPLVMGCNGLRSSLDFFLLPMPGVSLRALGRAVLCQSLKGKMTLWRADRLGYVEFPRPSRVSGLIRCRLFAGEGALPHGCVCSICISDPIEWWRGELFSPCG